MISSNRKPIIWYTENLLAIISNFINTNYKLKSLDFLINKIK